MTVPPSRSGGSSGGPRRSVLPASLPSLAARSLILSLLLAADGLGGHGLAVGGDPVGAAGGRGQRPERGRVGLGAVLAALPGDIGPAQALQGRSAAAMACLLAGGGACGGGLAVGGDPVGAAGGRGQRPERRGVALGVLAAGQIDPTQVIYGRVLDVRWPGASERGLPPVGRGSPHGDADAS